MTKMYLTDDTLTKLEQLFPQAYSFLRVESLKGEKIALRKVLRHAMPKRKEWIENRLDELSLVDV